MTDPAEKPVKPEPAMTLPNGYRPAHNPVLLLDPNGNTVDWSNPDHMRAFSTTLAAELRRHGVTRTAENAGRAHPAAAKG